MNIVESGFKELSISEFVSFGGNMKIKDVLVAFNKIIENNLPDDKRIEDFTGGYIQQLTNSNQLVMYFGYKRKFNEESGKYETTKNKATKIVNIDSTEVDLVHVGLKAKVLDIRLNKHKGKHKSVSMMEHLGNAEVMEPEKLKAIKYSPIDDLLCGDCGLVDQDCKCYPDDD